MLAGQLVVAVPLVAQGPGDSATVRLSVRHAGAPLPGASVRVQSSPGDTGTTLRALSGAPGVVVLRLPAPGEYQLAVSAIGYAGIGLALRLRAAQPDTAIIVELEPEAEELEELIVSSTRSDRRI